MTWKPIMPQISARRAQAVLFCSLITPFLSPWDIRGIVLSFRNAYIYIIATVFKEFSVSWERQTGKQKGNVTLQEQGNKNGTQDNRQSGGEKPYLRGWRGKGCGGGSRKSKNALTPRLAFEGSWRLPCSSGAPRKCDV